MHYENLQFNINIEPQTGNTTVDVSASLNEDDRGKDNRYTKVHRTRIKHSGDWDKTMKNLSKVVQDHPFSQLLKCESPQERKFFVYAFGKFPDIEPQHIVEPYRLDFALPKKKLNVEVDGRDFHSTEEQKKRDDIRDSYLKSNGWTICRYKGSDVHFNPSKCVDDTFSVLEQIPGTKSRSKRRKSRNISNSYSSGNGKDLVVDNRKPLDSIEYNSDEAHRELLYRSGEISYEEYIFGIW